MTGTQGYAVTASTAAELKRKQIIEAARLVLARDGLAGCTVRAVADAGPLTKSAVHYYFRDIDEIIDLAVAAHVEAMLATLREVAARRPDPRERLRAVVGAYLDTFADNPHAAFLWFEHWIATGRRRDSAPVGAMLAAVEALLDELLAAAPGPGRDRDPRGLLSWLLGTVVQQHVRPRPPAELAAEVDRVLAAFGGRR